MKYKINSVSKEQFHALKNFYMKEESCKHNEIESEKVRIHGDKVYKFFLKKKKIFTSDKFYSYGKKFIKAVARAQKRGINVPTIIDVYRYKKNYIIVYEKIEGCTVYNKLNNANSIKDRVCIYENTIRHLVELHRKNISHSDLRKLQNMIINQSIFYIDNEDMRFSFILFNFVYRVKDLSRLLGAIYEFEMACGKVENNLLRDLISLYVDNSSILFKNIFKKMLFSF